LRLNAKWCGTVLYLTGGEGGPGPPRGSGAAAVRKPRHAPLAGCLHLWRGARGNGTQPGAQTRPAVRTQHAVKRAVDRFRSCAARWPFAFRSARARRMQSVRRAATATGHALATRLPLPRPGSGPGGRSLAWGAPAQLARCRPSRLLEGLPRRAGRPRAVAAVQQHSLQHHRPQPEVGTVAPPFPCPQMQEYAGLLCAGGRCCGYAGVLGHAGRSSVSRSRQVLLGRAQHCSHMQHPGHAASRRCVPGTRRSPSGTPAAPPRRPAAQGPKGKSSRWLSNTCWLYMCVPAHGWQKAALVRFRWGGVGAAEASPGSSGGGGGRDRQRRGEHARRLCASEHEGGALGGAPTHACARCAHACACGGQRIGRAWRLGWGWRAMRALCIRVCTTIQAPTAQIKASQVASAAKHIGATSTHAAQGPWFLAGGSLAG
jgi:hypothetical protein